MKLFSRKSLVATAATAALFAGALTVPASAEESTPVESSTQAAPTEETTPDESSTKQTVTVTAEPTPDLKEPEEELSSSEEFIAGSSDDDGNLKASAIRDWIAVFTAIIGALSTVFVFSERINK